MAAAQQKPKKERGSRQNGRPNGKAWKRGKTPGERLEEERLRNLARASRKKMPRLPKPDGVTVTNSKGEILTKA